MKFKSSSFSTVSKRKSEKESMLWQSCKIVQRLGLPAVCDVSEARGRPLSALARARVTPGPGGRAAPPPSLDRGSHAYGAGLDGAAGLLSGVISAPDARHVYPRHVTVPRIGEQTAKHLPPRRDAISFESLPDGPRNQLSAAEGGRQRVLEQASLALLVPPSLPSPCACWRLRTRGRRVCWPDGSRGRRRLARRRCDLGLLAAARRLVLPGRYVKRAPARIANQTVFSWFFRAHPKPDVFARGTAAALRRLETAEPMDTAQGLREKADVNKVKIQRRPPPCCGLGSRKGGSFF